MRLPSLVATSVIVAGLTPLALSAPAQAQALPASYSASAHADSIDLNATLLGTSVAGVAIGHALSTVDSALATDNSVSESANVDIAVGGTPIPVDTATATAPPTDDPASTTLAPIDLAPVATVGAITGDPFADYGSAISCPSTAATQLLSDTVTTIDGMTLAQLPLPAPLDLTVAQVGASEVHTTTKLVENAGNPGHWDVRSESSNEVGDVSLLSGAVQVHVASPVTTFANSDGTTGTAGYTTVPTVSVTVGAQVIDIPLNAQPQSIPVTIPGLNISLNVTAFSPTDLSTGAVGEADLDDVVTIDLVVSPTIGPEIANVHLGLAGQHVMAVAPTGGVECAAIAAAPVITAPANGSTTSDQTPTITGTATYGNADDPGTVTVKDGDGNTICTATVQPDGTWSCTPATDLPPGSYTITAVETSSTATSPASAPVTFTIEDTTAPAPPVIQTPADGSTTTDPTPAVTGTAEAGSTVTVFDTDGITELCTATTNGLGNWTCTPASAMAEGLHTITATATDASNNTSAASAPNTFTIDSVAPDAPVIQTPADGSSTSDTTPKISGTAEANSAVTVFDTDGTTVLCVTTADGTGAWSCTSATLTEGPHTITATSTDAAGNTSPASAPNTFTVDTVAPDAPVIQTPANGSTTNDNTPLITGTAEADSDVTVYDTDGTTVLCTTTADGTGAWSCTSAPLPDGSHTITATSTDAAGNTSPASAPVTFTVDATAPAAPVIQSPTDGSSTNNTTPPISGTAEPGSEVEVTEGNTVLCTALTDQDGNWTCTPADALGEGEHTIDATATDAAGNTSPADSVTFTVDTTAPSAPVITGPEDGATVGDTTPAIIGTAEPGSTVTVTEGGTELCTATADAQGTWSCSPATALPDGDHTITATATDDADNTSTASAPVTFTVDSDLDDDGLPNTQETAIGTDPNDPDTDNDGLTDGQEVKGFSISVCGRSAVTMKTNPLKADTDADGLSDGREKTGSLNTKYGSKATNPKVGDTDGEGLKDGVEVKGVYIGIRVTTGKGSSFLGKVKTNPCKVDTDADGLPDYREKVGTKVNQKVLLPKGKVMYLKLLKSNPATKDTDRDGLQDKPEVTGSMNTEFNRHKSDPAYWDTDRGGVSDGLEIKAHSDPTNVLSTPSDPRVARINHLG